MCEVDQSHGLCSKYVNFFLVYRKNGYIIVCNNDKVVHKHVMKSGYKRCK